MTGAGFPTDYRPKAEIKRMVPLSLEGAANTEIYNGELMPGIEHSLHSSPVTADLFNPHSIVDRF